MRIAALYDVHGNLPALEAVLDAVEREKVDLILFGGDIVAGPLPRGTLERVRALGDRATAIRGNADREVVNHARGGRVPWHFIEWAAAELDEAAIGWLDSLPEQRVFDIDGLGPVRFCHATVRNDEEIVTPLAPQEVFDECFGGATEPTVVCGHVHVPYERRVGDCRVVNAGSVGMPYGGREARWLLLGPDIEFRATAYDLDAAAARIRARGGPQVEQFVERNLFNPPSAYEALSRFEEWAGREPPGEEEAGL